MTETSSSRRFLNSPSRLRLESGNTKSLHERGPDGQSGSLGDRLYLKHRDLRQTNDHAENRSGRSKMAADEQMASKFTFTSRRVRRQFEEMTYPTESISRAPQFNPAPNAANITGPGHFPSRARHHSVAAINSDADDVFPYRCKFRKNLCSGTPSACATRVRRFKFA